jgi:hypothetical protein
LQDSRLESDRGARRVAEVHVAICESCQSAIRAVAVLKAERSAPVPQPPPGAFERALRKATQTPVATFGGRRGFWWGVGVGGALAATIAIALLNLLPAVQQPAATAAPGVTLALYETRDVNITLDSPVALANAEIHIVLSGAIELQGFEGEKELRWSTDLGPGVNQLTLPVVAFGAAGGQLTVEVQHEERRRVFIVDVRTSGVAGSENVPQIGVWRRPRQIELMEPNSLRIV